MSKAQIRAGTFLSQSRVGLFVRSDAAGRVALAEANHLRFLVIAIRKPGYAFCRTIWNGVKVDGPNFTAKLQAAWTLGAVVVDAEGKPVPNAGVTLRINFTGRPGEGDAGGIGDRAWTNQNGVWRFESVPISMIQVPVEINEPNFIPVHTRLTRAEFGVAAGHEPTAKITLRCGLTLSGAVTDDAGHPISKALVRTRVTNGYRSAFTAANGTYRLEGCQPGRVNVVATAKGHAPNVRSIDVTDRMRPVDFRLAPGGTIRVRIVDERGRPVPEAQISLQRGPKDRFEVDQAPLETDNDGIWQWNEAPPGPIVANIGAPDHLFLNTQTLVAGKEEYVVRVASAIAVSGRVIDAETKQPIQRFRAVAGMYAPAYIFWLNKNEFAETAGRYKIREHAGSGAYLVRIEADGYLPGVSRPIQSGEDTVDVDFALVKGRDIRATVLTPNGTPAHDAQVVLAIGGQSIRVEHGALGQREGAVAESRTDATGQFHITAKNDDFWLVIVHGSGCASLAGLPSTHPRTITLSPWARLEGTFQIARKPVSGIEISLGGTLGVGQIGPQVILDSREMTDSRGHFVFDRVVPGRLRIACREAELQADPPQVMSSSSAVVDCPAGQTTRFDFGKTGRPVVGQLRWPPDSKIDTPLNRARIVVHFIGRNAVPVPNVTFTATADDHGNFAIDDVPPSSYVIYGFFPRIPGPRLPVRTFTVSTVDEKLSQRPVDLGVLTLTTDERKAAPVRNVP